MKYSIITMENLQKIKNGSSESMDVNVETRTSMSNLDKNNFEMYDPEYQVPSTPELDDDINMFADSINSNEILYGSSVSDTDYMYDPIILKQIQEDTSNICDRINIEITKPANSFKFKFDEKEYSNSYSNSNSYSYSYSKEWNFGKTDSNKMKDTILKQEQNTTSIESDIFCCFRYD